MLRKIRTSAWLLLGAVLAGQSLSCAAGGPGQVVGSGTLATETRKVSPFTRVVSNGSYDVVVTAAGPGGKSEVVVEADDNLLPILTSEVVDGTLILSSRRGWSTKNPVVFRVTTPTIEGLELAGSGSVVATAIDSGKLALRLAGSGNLKAAGKVESLDISLSGSGNVYTVDLDAQAAAVSLSGSGNVALTARSSLDATVSGSGNVTYAGDPASVNTRVSGSGNIRRR